MWTSRPGAAVPETAITTDGQVPVRPVVVVPVHRASPIDSERVALRQCGRCLAGHDIVLLAPKGLDLGAYRELMPASESLRIDPRWMSGRREYNRLMITPLVYDAMADYTHMLVHEPDAIVLRDELEYWCRQPFDYIGAPWFDRYSDALPDARVIGAGNFGFSLRVVSAARAVLASGGSWYPLRGIVADLLRGALGDRKGLQRGLRTLRRAGRLRDAANFYEGNCDSYWAQVVPRRVPEFRVAPPQRAARFSWEVLPRRCQAMTHGALPFGAHAWARYEPGFWLPRLAAAGVDLSGLDVESFGAVGRGGDGSERR
jgi:hypothetical protein